MQWSVLLNIEEVNGISFFLILDSSANIISDSLL